jgi:hypothetical protein
MPLNLTPELVLTAVPLLFEAAADLIEKGHLSSRGFREWYAEEQARTGLLPPFPPNMAAWAAEDDRTAAELERAAAEDDARLEAEARGALADEADLDPEP